MTSSSKPAPRATAKRDLVRAHLIDVIERSGPGTSLTAERDLAAELGVSRPTIRAAVEDLIRSGLLVRQHGRGTFTAPHKVTQEMTGTTTNALAVPPAEGDWTSHVVSFATAPAGHARAARLGVEPDDGVLRVVRLRFVDGEAMSIERLELPAHLVDGLTAVDMEQGNFYHLLRERFRVTVHDAVQTVEPTVATPEQADLLDCPVYAPLLQITRVTRDTTGRTVEHAQAVYRGDRYRITSKLRFDASSG
ncbi:GntR family transcriptional regulator [Streptomyces tateyamensis]|uniref:GntR family transcriptional regulator n=1 Tax=Streptomyces tateyamensis TaxID=565073 RepID=A0A2V4NR87_9ACTN|nr:GntR family transcriptional regulator [Streptomyces tateyamensis]PYC88512.1 GntR family transcriptional regulator [Streptomyces tateyamensis]